VCFHESVLKLERDELT